MSSYYLSVISLIGINVVLGLSLNLIMGFCGQVSLGHAAFYAIGAYVTALMLKAGVNIGFVVPSAALASGVAGLIVGSCSLRVRDDSLAIATMAVGLIFIGVVHQSDFLGNEMGISAIPAPWSRATLGFVCVGSAGVAALLCLYIRYSWLGFAFQAVANDEEASRTIGIDDRWYKIVAFSLGTAIAGFAGTLFALYLRSVGPDAFGVNTSFSLLPIVILGGLGSVWGTVVAATLLTLFPEVFRFANDYKLLTFGVLLIGVIFIFPDGLAGIPNQFRRRPPRLRSPGGEA